MTPATPSKERRLSTETIVVIILAFASWVFSAGMIWQKVDDLEKKVDRIERYFEPLTKPNADLRR